MVHCALWGPIIPFRAAQQQLLLGLLFRPFDLFATEFDWHLDAPPLPIVSLFESDPLKRILCGESLFKFHLIYARS